VRVEKGNDSLQMGQGKRVVLLEMGDDVLSIRAGNQTTKLDLGRSTTEAVQGIELRVGPNRILIEPTGIVIEGLVVKVRGHACTEVAGLMTQVGADAVLEVKGGATLVG
jgi:type VI secretion system secreted protein VgrG